MKALCLALAGLVFAACAALSSPGSGLVANGGKGPVSPDGDVAGRATDLVINFSIPVDPAIPGRTLLAGRRIRIALPPEFTDTGAAPTLDYAGDPRCGPRKLACNTAALLQGWPQNPVPAAKYGVTLERKREIVITAREDIAPVSELAPGIKGVHLMLTGFRNPPAAGHYRVRVYAETGPNGSLESGEANVEIAGHVHPSIQVTSVFDQPAHLARLSPHRRASSIVQEASPGELVPMPYNLLLWNGEGKPFTGVSIEPTDEGPGRYALVRDGVEVGRVAVTAPPGAGGFYLIGAQPSFEVKAPVNAVPAARLRSIFRIGDRPGMYTVVFSLHGGNSARLLVRAYGEERARHLATVY